MSWLIKLPTKNPSLLKAKKDSWKAWFRVFFVLHLELILKIEEKKEQDFKLFKTLKAHVLPLTNCSFNKNGDKFITGSYDRTCKIWET